VRRRRCGKHDAIENNKLKRLLDGFLAEMQNRLCLWCHDADLRRVTNASNLVSNLRWYSWFNDNPKRLIEHYANWKKHLAKSNYHELQNF
jgi:hypothetical protein